MKLSHGDVKALIGCWTHPGTTSVYTMERMAKEPWRSRSSKYNFQGLIIALTWSNGFCCERGKRGGMVGKGRCPWQRNALLINFNDIFWGALYTTLPTRQAHKAHFSASIWCNESWEACPLFMYLDHIIVHEKYHFFHTVPLKLAPTCFIKQCGASKTQELECIFVCLVYQLTDFVLLLSRNQHSVYWLNVFLKIWGKTRDLGPTLIPPWLEN